MRVTLREITASELSDLQLTSKRRGETLHLAAAGLYRLAVAHLLLVEWHVLECYPKS
jgi:hypothetical protein